MPVPTPIGPAEWLNATTVAVPVVGSEPGGVNRMGIYKLPGEASEPGAIDAGQLMFHPLPGVALINEMCGGTAPLPVFVLHDDPSPVPDEPPACGTAAARQIASLHARDVRVRDCLNCGGRFSIKSGRATRTTRGRKDADHCSPSCANAYSSRRSYHAAKAGADPSVAQQRP